MRETNFIGLGYFDIWACDGDGADASQATNKAELHLFHHFLS